MECMMQGQITKFRDDLGFGVIRSDDGRTYRFSSAEITNPNGKVVGLDVDFLVESARPREIILLHGSPWTVFQSGKRS
jgi:cold shock CspA family protein